jgi:hypothetical protein
MLIARKVKNTLWRYVVEASMTTTALPSGEADENLLKAALALTGSEVTSEAVAAEVFATVARGRKQIEAWEDQSFTTADWIQAQQLLRGWLPKIAKVGAGIVPSARSQLILDINRHLHAPFAPPVVRLSTRGVVLDPDPQDDSIGSACLRAVLLFFMKDGVSPRRLGQCRLDTCKRWFLRPKPKRGSVVLYCKPEHANVAHQRAYRQRKESEE